MSKNNLTKSSSELGKRFKSLIYKSNNNKIDLLNILKSQYSFQQIKNIIPEIISHPLANKFIYGTALPKTYAELNTGIYSLTSDLEHELNWNLFSITKYRNEINKFLSEKTQFENELLLGKYSKANQTLSKISKICHSNWELENRFLIEELQGGLEKNKEFLSKINEDNIDSLLALIIHFYSNRAEKKISFTRYSALVNAYINEDFSENFRDYLSFKLNYFNVKSIANIEWIISIEEKSSIFDKYLIQILVCQEIICNKKDYNNYTQYAIHSLEILKRYIQDPIIDKLLLINNPDHQYDLHPYDEAIIELFDLYVNRYRCKQKYRKRFCQINSYKPRFLSIL
jgi:hypothetical protein